MSQDDEPKKVGRPSKFNEQVASKIIELVQDGLTDDQIGELIGISRSTISLWRSKNIDFSVAIKRAKAFADDLVETALFQRAVGFKAVSSQDIELNGEVVTLMGVKHHPPDTAAGIFWLKNRKPEEWRDKQDIEMSGKDGKPLNSPQIIIMLPSNGRESKDGK